MDGIRDSEDESVYETRRLAREYLSQPEMPPEARRYLLNWQSNILSGQAIGAIRSHKPRRALEYVRFGWQQDHSWPFVFLRKMFIAFIERIR